MRRFTRRKRLVWVASVSTLLWLAGSGWLGWWVAASKAVDTGSGGEEPSSRLAVPATPGNELLLAAISALEQRRSLFARVTQQSHVFGVDAVGSGTYVQYRDGDVRKFRLELKTQAAGKTSSLLHLSDGRHLWTDLVLPSGRVVRRLDLRTLSAATLTPFTELDREPVPEGAARVQPSLAQHAGGVARLLASLTEAFEFEVVEVTSVYLLRGRLRPGRLQVDAQWETSRLTGHVPQEVVLAVGREDLFPRLVEFHGSQRQRRFERPLLRMTWSDVTWDGIVDTGQFEYVPPNDWEDFTESYLKRLGAS